jgi:hypothetical protein
MIFYLREKKNIHITYNLLITAEDWKFVSG